MIECNLCGMQFNEKAEMVELVKEVHERWHKNCKAEKRNTTEGEVIWLKECPYCYKGWQRDVGPNGYDEECWKCQTTGLISF